MRIEINEEDCWLGTAAAAAYLNVSVYQLRTWREIKTHPLRYRNLAQDDPNKRPFIQYKKSDLDKYAKTLYDDSPSNDQ